MSTALYPWQQGVWQRLLASRQRLPHAILLRGRSGSGKFAFARAMAQALLCEQPQADGQACGSCASCGWFEQDNHPDYRLLSPEQDNAGEDEVASTKAKKTQISVKQVRELGSFLELSSHHGAGLRIALIHPAEALNQASANALLKVLEEPPPGVVFLLVSHQPQRLLPTILSRCHKVDMPVPDSASATAWLTQQGVSDAETLLAYAGGSPLAALEAAEQGAASLGAIWQALAQGGRLDPFALAAPLAGLGMELAMSVLQKWCYDLMLCRHTGQLRYHVQHASALQALAERVDLGLLLEYQRRLNEARKSALHPLNQELQLENLLILYVQLFAARSVRKAAPAERAG